MGRPRLAIIAFAALILFLGAPCRADERPLIASPVRTVALDLGDCDLESSNLLRLEIGIAADAVPANSNLDRWSRRSARATHVGIPALPILQGAIGSGRPEDGNSTGSRSTAATVSADTHTSGPSRLSLPHEGRVVPYSREDN